MTPIYEFRCPEGHLHERHVPVAQTSADLRRCPECGADAARIISLPQPPVIRGGTPVHHEGRARTSVP